MKTIVAVVVVLVGAIALLVAQRKSEAAASSGPEFTEDNRLLLPANYREWVFLSSGLGMTYGPVGDANRDRPPMFDNVFVNPDAYRSFMKTGTWPEKTMFVLEIRASASKGSINNGGHYQSGTIAAEAEVKDTARLGGWAFFAFGTGTSGKQIPKTAACYTCHSQKGAVDNTFVQFYPTLLPVAKEKGTLTPGYAAAAANEGH
jgi:hypothetical protein